MNPIVCAAHDQYEQLVQLFTQQQLDAALLSANKADIIHAFTYSDFIQKIANQYPASFASFLSAVPVGNITKSHYSEIAKILISQLQDALASTSTSQALELKAGVIIRQFRHIKMLEIAWLDIHHQQSIETSLYAVSNLADIIICEAYNCLHKAMSTRYGEPQQNQQLLIIAMGKLGGGELNFSSDIDLIFTYPSQGETQHPKKPLEHQVFFTRLAQKFITMLDQVTQDGFAYRVDMRLRPLGDSGPLVLPFSAFENYYQEQGRQWERFAMQKMRIVNNTPHKTKLQKIIQPFVYRKYIDFTTIESIREMKSLIEKEVRRRQIDQNIKLGKGGIREVEFYVQSLQLIHAGRHLNCQRTSILAAMNALEQQGLTGDIDMQQLTADYLFLRQVEHYLQAFNDEQTQTLPADTNNQLRLATLLKHNNYQQTKQVIAECMARINTVFASIIDDANQTESLATQVGDDENEPHHALVGVLDDIWTLSLGPDEAMQAIDSALSEDCATLLIELIGKFKKKVERAGVSARALQSVDRLMPLLLCELVIVKESFDDNVFIDQATGIFNILQTVSGRVTYIDLLLEHPKVRHRLLNLCKKSVWVAQQIAQYPILLDELLYPVYLDENDLSLDDWEQELKDQLRQTMLRIDVTDEELVMDRLREFKHTSQLRIAASDIAGTLAINQVSDKLTLLAEVMMQYVMVVAWQQITTLYGIPCSVISNDDISATSLSSDNDKEQSVTTSHIQITNKHLGLIAYGKFGGIELSYGSDLDVVFLHDADLSGNTDGTGTRKQVSNQEFYIKLAQRICHICTTKTYNGILYDIDLRLRPSGNSGLLVSHIESFYEYQQSTAWTWEHQALVRSRVIVANNSLAKRFNQIRQSILTLQRDASLIRQEVFDMREKMRTHLKDTPKAMIDIKQTHGGIVDVEFMVQYWVLTCAYEHPSIVVWSDNLRLLETLANLHIIAPETEQALSHAYLTMRHAGHRIQLANKQFARGGEKQSTNLKVALEKVANVYKTVFAEQLSQKE